MTSPVTPERVQIPTGSPQALPALLWRPDGPAPAGGRPGIVLLQEIFGLSAYIRQRAADLADLGAVVLAPQLYARLTPPIDATDEHDDPDQLLAEGMAAMQALPWEQATADALAALDHLRTLDGVDPQRVGLMGFCYGGGLAYQVTADAARAGRAPAVLVSFYGSALPQLTDLADHVTVPSLHVFGTADDFIPLPEVERIRDAVTASGSRPQVEFELFDGAGHAFDNPLPPFHHAEASRAAWTHTEEFLRRTLLRDDDQG
ncbi:dienelactone hydrolase family protein [Brachybacterium sp. EF45031]|uniref:dienelactone hydrolase family protein n=1 Tax=Brachybacterium sillae TaxID=2810536 RepID=UPI00217CFDEB|nr:dienelactone hydrolase family protein [Brachybacterium sillae]MCS6712249.1 dienelactone hydrolase family protein [Brachybacterium sillae]